MNMWHYVKLFPLSLIIFVAIDYVWLGIVARSFYRQEIGAIMRSQVDVVSAIAVYALLVAGIMAFVLPKAAAAGWPLFGWGIVFGLVVYGVYDFTNYAVLAQWTWKVTLVDMLWGGLVCGINAWIIGVLDKWMQ